MSLAVSHLSIYEFSGAGNAFVPEKVNFWSDAPFSPGLSAHDRARACLRLGWSVIPLVGAADPARAKHPALPSWKLYQSRSATPAELSRWFAADGRRGVGIVLGTISGLVVLDLDSPERARTFFDDYPDLAQTFTVQSGNRQLPHLYFRIPAGLRVPGRSAAGAELRAEGQYVVAPGVSVGERCWQVSNPQPPRMLSEADLRRLLAFIGSGPVNPVRKASAAVLSQHKGDDRTGVAPVMTDAAALARMYRARAPQIGRNNALFETACFARDHGLTKRQTNAALIALHVDQPAVGDHHAESESAREREGRTTIASAYSRPPRDRVDRAKRGLPNAVREKLLQLDLDRLARVLDAMLMAGIKPGQAFTIQQIYERLQPYGIGRGTLYAAMRADLPDDDTVFAQVLGSAPLHPPPPDANAASSGAEHTKQCLFGRATNPVKNRGRPRLAFRMPAPDALARRLAVSGKRSDRLAPEDLHSPAAYRAALHRALIQRAPGQYGRAWLAERLGVSRRSCRRYERRTGVHVEPSFSVWPVRWGTVEQVMPEEAGPGQFLQDERGRRYPPMRALAHKLLAAGRRVMYVQQDANRYSVPEPAALSPVTESPRPAANRPAGYPRPDYAPAVAFPSVSDSHTHKTAQSVPVIDVPISPGSVPSTADTLYTTLRARNPERSLTRAAAARLADVYGPALINRGLRVLSQKQQVHNPAGFLCAWLRSAAPHIPFPWTRQQPEAASDTSAESAHSAWLQAMKDSPYLQYISNADDIVRAAAGD